MTNRFAQFVVFFFVLGASAQGSTNTVTIQSGQGLSQALVAGGCNVLWLAQTIADNNIRPDSLRNLPADSVITIPENCETAPAPGIARLSRLIMGADRRLGRAISADEGRRLKDRIEGLTLGRAELQTQVGSLETQVVDLTEQLRKAREEKMAGGRNIPLVVFSLFMTVLAGCLAVGLYLNNRSLIAKTRENAELEALRTAPRTAPPVIEYEIGGGVTAVFTRVENAEEALLHSCSLCPGKAPVERKNVLRHLRRVHGFNVNSDGAAIEPVGVETVSVM